MRQCTFLFLPNSTTTLMFSIRSVRARPYCIVYLLENGVGCPPPQEQVVPVKVFINLGSLLEVTRIPVIWQLVLVYQVGHDCRTICISKTACLHDEHRKKETDLSARQNPLSLIAGTCLLGLASLRSSLVTKSPIL